MDARIERRLHDISHALESFQDQGPPEVVAYCNRLNRLVRAVLVSAEPMAAPATGEAIDAAPGGQPVRPRMRRR